MSLATKKLKGKGGASIVIALLVLLICVTAGAAALTAASANAGRYTHLRQDQQRYLAVSSAAKLVRAELCGGHFTATAVMKENKGADPDSDELPFELELGAGGYTGAFGPWLEEDMTALFQANAIPVEWWSQAGLDIPDGADGASYTGLKLDVEGVDEELLSKVKWELKLEDDYSLTATFWLEDGGARYYPTVLTIPVQVVRDETSEPERIGAGQRWRTTKTFELAWDEADAVITQG